ncbi:MAG: aldo/keto reductase [Bacteroidetes bacterium]|nr:MAG: aldo/keto reductase [Bacteroidota bacterium]
MSQKITRRQFVQTTAAAAATVAIAPVTGCISTSPYNPKGLPTVKLGKTDAVVPLLGFGCGSRWMAVQDNDKALGILEFAFNQGLYYWDTASSYGNEKISSEERIGIILKERREQVFLSSKTGDREGDLAKKSVEQSLKRLQTDHIDLLHVHAISSVEDAEDLGEKGKVLEVLDQFKSEGVIRNIGFTGHASAAGMKRAVELYDFDVMMMALNHQSTDGAEDFEGLPAPLARQKGMGVVAMKVIRPRETVNGLAANDLVRYALTLDDFHMANIGMDSMEVLKSNLETLQNFAPLGDEKMNEVRLALQPFYRGKNLAWMQTAYQDAWSHGITIA